MDTNSSDEIIIGIGCCSQHDFWYDTYSEINHHLIFEHTDNTNSIKDKVKE